MLAVLEKAPEQALEAEEDAEEQEEQEEQDQLPQPTPFWHN